MVDNALGIMQGKKSALNNARTEETTESGIENAPHRTAPHARTVRSHACTVAISNDQDGARCNEMR